MLDLMSRASGAPRPDHPLGRFVAGHADPAAARDVVLARVGEPPRPDAVVLTRAEERYELRRVGRITAEAIELLPLDGAGPPLRVAPDAPSVVGTVLLRWSAAEDAVVAR